MFRDAINRPFQGVLYFQNVIMFEDETGNVILFTTVRKTQPSLHQFSRNSHMLKRVMGNFIVPNFTQIE